MTDQELLDYFAGCVLTGIISQRGETVYDKERLAYHIGAAMMAERKKRMEKESAKEI